MNEADRAKLESLSRARKSAQAIKTRAKAVLLSAQGLSDTAISKQVPLSHASVGKWRKRFIEHGIEGLTDAPRSGPPRRISDELAKLSCQLQPLSFDFPSLAVASTTFKELEQRIGACRTCANAMPHAPRPVFSAHPEARIVIIGQAPGAKVHASGTPWDDPSGRLLRKWLAVDDATFYDARKFALMPMGFCFPGKAKNGDLPPRPECAPQWHQELLDHMPQIQTAILIGRYAQEYYLGENYESVTENVRRFDEYLPTCFPLPHPSPLNRGWFKRNPWFEETVLPELRELIAKALDAN